jgi:uncharacterized protein (DUF924 family)
VSRLVPAEDVLAFWFGTLDPDGVPPPAYVARWFEPPDGFDDELRARFGAVVEAALAGTLDGWARVPRERLALVLLLDQLTRNLFRGTARAFAGDAQALALALAAIDAGEAPLHAPVERSFLYLPLMHAEDLALQDRCIALYAALVATSQGPVVELFRKNHAFAQKHREPIERIGRFPSRNAALGRESTPEERVWLEAHPSGF